MDFTPNTPIKKHFSKGAIVMGRKRESYDVDTQVYGQGEVDTARTGRPPLKTERRTTSESVGSQYGKRSGVELVPKPSAEPEDPLNWSRTRREFAYFSLVLTIASLMPLKMMLLTISQVVATQLSVSYTATTALTGVPLVIGAFAGLLARIVSQMTGKRVFLLMATILALLGALWNMHIDTSYAQFMVARIFQGVGWGVVEALGSEIVEDMFFVHQRKSRMVGYNTVSILFTWGSPILGGFLSQCADGYSSQIMVINIIQAVSISFLILALPETSFDRSVLDPMSSLSDPPTLTSGFTIYLSSLKLWNKYSTQTFSMTRALRPIKALASPSTTLITFLTAPILGAAMGSAHSISLLFSAMPTFLFPARVGYIFTFPLILGLVSYGLTTLISYLQCKPPRHLSASVQGTELAISCFGMVFGIAGMLAWGFYTVGELDVGQYSDGDTVFSLSVTGLDLSLTKVSLLLGMLVAGATMLSYAGNAYLYAAGSYGRHTAAAHRTSEEVWTGLWVYGTSGLIAEDVAGLIPGLRSTVVALGVVGIFLGLGATVMLWVKGRDFGGVDERFLGGGEEEGDEIDGLNRKGTGGSSFGV